MSLHPVYASTLPPVLDGHQQQVGGNAGSLQSAHESILAVPERITGTHPAPGSIAGALFGIIAKQSQPVPGSIARILPLTCSLDGTFTSSPADAIPGCFTSAQPVPGNIAWTHPVPGGTVGTQPVLVTNAGALPSSIARSSPLPGTISALLFQGNINGHPIRTKESFPLSTTLPLHSALFSGCFLGSLGVLTHILPKIQVQTYSLSFISLLSSSTNKGMQTLSSHLITILQGLIVGDGDGVSRLGEIVWVTKNSWGLHQSICACLQQLKLVLYSRKTIQWISCFISLRPALAGRAPSKLGS